MATSVTAMRRSSVNRRSEATSSRSQAAAEGSRQVLAVTDADFPRVLNGPAPGYAEDALERLLLGKHVLDEGHSTSSSRSCFLRRVEGAPERAAAPADGAQEAANRPLYWSAGQGGVGVDKATGLESTTSRRVSGMGGHFGAALSEGAWCESEDNEGRGQQHQQVRGQVTRWCYVAYSWDQFVVVRITGKICRT